MVTLERWSAAQEYERGFWQQQAGAIANGAVGQLDWYQWRANDLVARLDALGLTELTNGSARVIEIGCGPVGVAAYFPAAARVAVDPLAPYYARHAALTARRSNGVRYLEGVGESLPVETGGHDLALIENCIDHVRDVEAVMKEIHRVLRPGGILHLTVNCRTPWGFYVHRTLSRLQVDRGHPHTFTADSARHLFARNSFSLLSFTVGSAAKAHREDLASPDPRTRIKGVLGVSEFVASGIARRS